MARGTRLAELRYMLMAEIGDNANSNNLRRIEMNQLLSNKQKWLASEYDWPFLQHQWDVECLNNTQYVTFPGTDVRNEAVAIDWERPVRITGFWNNYYNEVEYGIGPREYNWQNFALGQQSDPIQRIQMVSNTRETVDQNQFEVWPVPVSTQTLRFQGQRMLEQMVADEDPADLDDMLLVYFVAAEMLTRKKQADAPEKLALAKQRLGRVMRVYPTRTQVAILGQKMPPMKYQTGVMPIAVHGGGGTPQQIYVYTGTDPTSDGIVPVNQNSGAIAYKPSAPTFTWDVVNHVWV